ncbi:MAG: helix-turn-helix domain-containing protein [Nitriliruptoraceae bacterium]
MSSAPDLHPHTSILLRPEELRTRQELGEALTALRHRSGRSLRDLAKAIGSSPSTLSGWCRADNLPFPAQYPTFAALLGELGIDDATAWLEVLARFRTNGTRPAETREPYLGLEPFGRDDADRFFGREAVRDRALTRLLARFADPTQANLLVLVGPSGSGKSSLLHAGLRPALEDLGHAVTACTPGSTPTARLEAARGTVAAAAVDGRMPVVLVDQAEELFTACSDDAERRRFLRELSAWCAPTADGPGAAVLTLRIDFYGDLVATGVLGDLLEDAQVLIGPMDREELRRAILEPAHQVGVSLDPDLVSLLLRDFVPASSMAGQHDVGSLPLLSHALLQTYRHARGRQLTVLDYEAAGGVRGAIERSAETVYEAASPEDQRLIREVLLRLVHVENGTLATRRVATYDELQGLLPPGDGRDISDLLEPLIAARLLTAQESTVEITHEALLVAWPRLQAWIEEARDAIRLHRRIAEATQLWLDSGRDPSALARGVLLDAMRAATGDPPPRTAEGMPAPVRLQLTRTEESFLAASVAQAEATAAAEQLRTHRLRLLVAVTTVFAVLASTLAVVAASARSEALQARDDALSRQLSVSADRLAETDPSLAAELAAAGFRTAPTTEARSALLDAAISPLGGRVLGGPGSTALVASADGRLLALGSSADAHVQLLTAEDGSAPLERAGLIELDDPDLEIYALALTPDAQLLAVGDTAARISLWDVRDPARPQPTGVELTGPEGPIQGLSVSPDGRELLAVGLGDGAFRYDLSSPGTPQPLPLLPADDITWSVAHAPDGDLVAVGTELGEVLLWEVTDPEAPELVTTLTPTERSVLSVAFAPDGTVLVAGSRAGTVHAYDLSVTPPEPIDLPEATFGSWVNALAFSPDGRHLAAGSSDGQLRLWQRRDWTPVSDIPHPGGLTSVTFTDAPPTLLTAGVDGHARRWDLDRTLPTQLPGRVWGVEFSADGTRMAAFAGGATGVFDVTQDAPPAALAPPVPSPADGPVFSGGGALSPDGQVLAQGTLTGEVVLLDASDPTDPRPLAPPLGGSDQLVETVTFTPDGRVLLAGGSDTDVRVWDVDDPAAPRLLSVIDTPSEIVLNLDVSPDGEVLAVASADNDVYLVDLSDPEAPSDLARLERFTSEAYGVAFSPDGTLLATSGTDAEVVLYDVRDPAAPAPVGEAIVGPSGRIYDLSWDPAGQRLAGAVVDGRTWVWDLSDPAAPQQIAVLGSDPSPVYTVGFHPDGRRLAAGGAAGRVWLWTLDEEAAIERVCAPVVDGITAEEWQVHLRDEPYEPPCG